MVSLAVVTAGSGKSNASTRGFLWATSVIAEYLELLSMGLKGVIKVKFNPFVSFHPAAFFMEKNDQVIGANFAG